VLAGGVAVLAGGVAVLAGGVAVLGAGVAVLGILPGLPAVPGVCAAGGVVPVVVCGDVLEGDVPVCPLVLDPALLEPVAAWPPAIRASAISMYSPRFLIEGICTAADGFRL